MVTTVIGRMFLKAYNEKYGSNYDAKTFFIEKFYPLFFANEKYFIWIQNSPMVQRLNKGAVLGPKELKSRLDDFISKVEGGQNEAGSEVQLDASIAVGYQAEKTLATTSGQVTIENLTHKPEDAYLSWIGAGLGIGVKGGVSLLIYHPQVLLFLYEGWIEYRRFLDTTPKLSGNQVSSWNAHWLMHKCSDTDLHAAFSAKQTGGEIRVEVLDWFSLLVALSKELKDPSFIAYVYSLGQTNKTIGFVPIELMPIRKTKELYEKLFSVNFDGTKDLYKTAQTFLSACIAGQIGLKQFEPKGLKEIMTNKKKIDQSDSDEKQIQNNIYQIWLLAMLNNEQLWEKAQQFAQALHSYETDAKKKRTDRTNRVKQLLEVGNKRGVIDKLSEIVLEMEDPSLCTDLAKLIHMMPQENVIYFITLVRFHYAKESASLKESI